MKIVIVGAGAVGASICKQLAGEGHDITVIDDAPLVVSELSNVCDIFGVIGNGAEISVLRRAGAENADVLIAVTSKDEINIICCAAAKKLGAKHTIARVRNPEYSELMQLLRDDMSLSMTINPELTTAREIFRMLKFPSASKIDVFCRGKVELAELVIDENSALCGATLNELRADIKINFLVCCVLREGQVYIPSGNFKLEPGDIIGVTVPDKEITNFFKAIGAYKNPVRNIIIVGGDRITYYLESILKDSNIKSTVIEKNKELCHGLVEQYDCTVVCDNGTKQEVLLEEGIESTDALLALSGVDEENAIVSLYAKSKNVGKIITLIGTMSYIDFFKSAGLDSIISPKYLTAGQILHYVRSMNATKGSEIKSIHKIMNGNIEALEFSVNDNIDGITDIPFKSLKPKAGVLVACIVREEKVIIPSGNDVIKQGDTVIVISADRLQSIKEIK